MSRFVTFGEIMLRLTPPDHEVLFQTSGLVATFGGAEANVAVSLANYGEKVSYVTAAPANPIGDAMVKEVRSFGIDTSFIARKGDRLGIYFTETGSSMRPSKVVYDRAGSSIAAVRPGDFDWDTILDGATWFHTTGITPSLAEGTAAVALEAVKACKAKGITVSCDLNYRKKLWKWGKTAREVMTEFAKYVDVTIANEEDCQNSLGITIGSHDVEEGQIDLKAYEAIAREVKARYPGLQRVAITLRRSLSADRNTWQACLLEGSSFFVSRAYDVTDIVDRVGAGDSFCGGLIYGLNRYDSSQTALEFAVAASCLKHTIPGDYNRVSAREVEALMQGSGSGRVQRGNAERYRHGLRCTVLQGLLQAQKRWPRVGAIFFIDFIYSLLSGICGMEEKCFFATSGSCAGAARNRAGSSDASSSRVWKPHRAATGYRPTALAHWMSITVSPR